MEQGGERLKSYSTAVYFHRVHEIYFPQLVEQWKYFLSIQWRYSETRVKQHPDQHRAGANHVIINGVGGTNTENLHVLLKTLRSCGDASFQNHIWGPYEQIVLTSQKKVKHPCEWMNFIPASVCAHTQACAHAQPDSCVFLQRLPKTEPVQYILQINWGGGGSSLVSKIKWKC